VAGVDEAVVGQREDLRADRLEEAMGVAALEVGSTAATDEERVAGEGHRAIVEHVARASGGMAGRGARFDMARAERNLLVRLQVAIGAFRAARGGDGDAATELLLEEPRAGDVIGMHVRLERELELEAKLVDERGIAP